MNPLAFIFIFALWKAVKADKNITVEGSDRTRIFYNLPEQWEVVHDSNSSDSDLKTTTFTKAQGASATFNFSGAHSIYFMGHGTNQDQVEIATIRVTLDGQVNDVPDNLSRNGSAQQILFSQTGLDVTQSHVITVEKTSPSGNHSVNVDAFIYTIPDSPSTTSTASTTATVTPSSHPAMSQSTIIGIVVGLVGTLGFLGALVFLYFNRRLFVRGNTSLPKTGAPPSDSSNPAKFLPASYVNAWSIGYSPHRKHQPTKPHIQSWQIPRLNPVAPLPKARV